MRVTALELFAVPPRWLFLELPKAVIEERSLRIHSNEDADLLDYVVDEERVREAARDTRMWHNPVWRNDDGTVAEW